MPSVKRLVVGVDRSAASRQALAWGAALAVAVDGEVFAVHVFPPHWLLTTSPAALVPQDASDLWRRELAEAVRSDWSGPARDAGVPCTIIVRDGNPATVLRDVAEELDAGLVIVGRQGTVAPNGTSVLGAVAHALVREGARPVAVISSELKSPPGVRRILVAFDDTARGLAAYDWALDLGRAAGSEVIVAATRGHHDIRPRSGSHAILRDTSMSSIARSARARRADLVVLGSHQSSSLADEGQLAHLPGHVVYHSGVRVHRRAAAAAAPGP